MATSAFDHGDTSAQNLLSHPAVWLGASAAGVLVTLGWLHVLGQGDSPARLVLLFLSLLSAGIAIWLRPSSFLVLAPAGAMGGLAWLSLDPWESHGLSCDSARWLMVALASVAGVASLIVLLPSVLRRVVVSLLVVFHFVTILSTVFSVPPAPWMATNFFAYVSRPYLDFVYLNNAYHFYSPDPGPPSLLWFSLEYEDGSRRTYKIPNREDFPTSVNYQRRLSLTEYTSHARAPDAVQFYWKQRRRERVLESIPYHPGFSDQYKEPNRIARWLIESYVRHVAKAYSPADGSGRVIKVRLYRLLHLIPEARSIARGQHPLELQFYLPFYQGVFDANGKLLDPGDPLLYWLVPMVPKDPGRGWVFPQHQTTLEEKPDGSGTYEVYNFFRVHAPEFHP